MRRKGELERVSKTVSDINAVLSGNEAFQFWLFQKRWEQIAGKALAEESYIGRKEGDTLFIYATNSVWLQEILMHRDLLLQRIREDEYGKRFNDFRASMAEKKREPYVKEALPGVTVDFSFEPDSQKIFLEDEEISWIHSWVSAHVTKEELHPIFENMMKNILRRKKWALEKGWKECPNCGNLRPPEEELCGICRLEQEKKVKNQLILLLKEKPEIQYQDATSAVPCTLGEFSEARDILIHRYKENFYHGFSKDDEIRRLLSLLTHRPFSEISREDAEKALYALPKKENTGITFKGVRNHG